MPSIISAFYWLHNEGTSKYILISSKLGPIHQVYNGVTLEKTMRQSYYYVAIKRSYTLDL
jgi:hypothetical protein